MRKFQKKAIQDPFHGPTASYFPIKLISKGILIKWDS